MVKPGSCCSVVNLAKNHCCMGVWGAGPIGVYREAGAPSPQPSPPRGEGAHRASIEKVDH